MNARLALTKSARFVVRLHPRLASRGFVRKHFRKVCVKDELVVATREGFKMAASPHDYASYGIYFYGEYDSVMSNMLKSHIREGGTCWDVGTERGWFSLLMAQLVGPNGRVDAFEAYAPNFKKLSANIALNNFHWIHPYNVGVSRQSGLMWFMPPSDSITHHVGYLADCGGVGYLTDHAQQGTLEVKTITLDDHAELTGISGLDFIKIDVEGAELDALQGGRLTIERFRPKMAIEYNRATALRSGTSIKEVDDLLDDLGYDRFILREHGGLARVHLEDFRDRSDNEVVFNVYCFPR